MWPYVCNVELFRAKKDSLFYFSQAGGMEKRQCFDLFCFVLFWRGEERGLSRVGREWWKGLLWGQKPLIPIQSSLKMESYVFFIHTWEMS